MSSYEDKRNSAPAASDKKSQSPAKNSKKPDCANCAPTNKAPENKNPSCQNKFYRGDDKKGC